MLFCTTQACIGALGKRIVAAFAELVPTTMPASNAIELTTAVSFLFTIPPSGIRRQGVAITPFTEVWRSIYAEMAGENRA